MNLVMISLLVSKRQVLKSEIQVFQPFYEIKLNISWHFEARDDIMTKFKSQALRIKRIKYGIADGSDNPLKLS